MENQFQLTNSKEIIIYLAQQFPNCFTIEGEAKPLKIGIFQDILSRLENSEVLSKTKLRVALRGYTMGWRYLYSIKEGTHRVDLDGNPTEVITKEQEEHAQQQLKESKEQFYRVYSINEGFETFCFTKITTIKFKKLDITLHSPLRLLNLGRNKRFLCLISTDFEYSFFSSFFLFLR